MTKPHTVLASPEAGESLPALLQRFGSRTRLRGKRQAQIARDSWLDESYVSRLLAGQRQTPSRDALILLGA
jgi:hypothetical protein